MPSQSNTSDFKGLTDWVEVFRAGTHKDSLGRTVTFSRSDLDEIANNLSASAPPPHVITHKALYSPFRYGDVVEAKREGDRLFIRSDNVEPAFESLVAQRRLPDRSIRLARTASGLNLAHVAWLGAEPPAVEGMAPVQFAAASDQVFDFSFQEVRSSGLLARALRRMREFLIEQSGVEVADRVMPDYEVEAAEELHVDARTEPASAQETSFAAPTPEPEAEGDLEMPAEKQTTVPVADFEASQAENIELKKKVAAGERAQRVSDFQKTVTVVIDAGRLTPAQTEGMAEFMATLSDAEDAQFEFSAGDATASKSPSAWFTDFVAKLGKQLDLDESDAGRELEPGKVVDFTAQPGYRVSEEKLVLHNKALDYQAKHPGTEYLIAVAAVS